MGRMTKREKYNLLYQHKVEIYSDIIKYKRNKTFVAERWEMTYNNIELALYFGGHGDMISPTSLKRFKATVYEAMEDAKDAKLSGKVEDVPKKKQEENHEKLTFIRKLDSEDAFQYMNVVEFQGHDGRYVVIQPRLVNDNGYWNVAKGSMPSIKKDRYDNVLSKLKGDKKTIKQLWSLSMKLYEEGKISFN